MAATGRDSDAGHELNAALCLLLRMRRIVQHVVDAAVRSASASYMTGRVWNTPNFDSREAVIYHRAVCAWVCVCCGVLCDTRHTLTRI